MSTTGSTASTSILGNRVLRKEDPKFLTTGGVYVDDVRMDLVGAAAVTYVRSTMASARILGIDADEARSAPGVLAVFTDDDVRSDLGEFPSDMGVLNQDMVRPWLARGTVRYVGEPVAIVVSETRAQGLDAAELVFVDYEPLPVVVDPEVSRTNETLLHEAAGTNLAFEIPGRKPADLDACEVVVRQRIVNQRVAPCPLEVRAAAALWTDEGRLTHWASTQGPHSVRDALAKVYGLDKAQVRVISPDVGGGFGAKGSTYPEELLMGWLARRVARPVKWVETRTESMLNLGHGRGQVQEVAIGGRRDGTIEAYKVHVLQDAGAYPRMGAVLPFMTRTMLTGVYAIPDAEFAATSVVTNTTPTVAYRGAGRPEAAAAVERAVDLFAAEIGMDPAEVRRRNFIGADEFPYKTRMGTTYDSGDYAGALDLALEAADYPELRAEQRRRRDAGDPKALGIGLSVYVEITGGGPSEEYGAIEIKPDGSVLARTGTSPHGQGHVTAWAMLISDRTGIPIDRIEVVHGDTDVVPRGGMTGGSRSLQVGGVAMHQAAGEVVEQAKALAADLLEANPDDVVLDTAAGRFHVAGTPAVAKDWGELASAASADGGPGLAVEHVFHSVGATFPSGAHVAVVEVDTETGKVTLQRLIAVDDAGRILNPLLAEGQVHGGLAQGAAQALLEEMVYDADGNPVTANLADYAFVSSQDLPTFELVHLETPTPLNELGAKGIGESGTIGATPAVHNAVVDALAHLGVRHIDMPCTAERVWRAIQERTAMKEIGT
ncbi:MAG TPA: xanthine dehydrogenase family protein molybdopterin-binding subunit [Acidimicrobiales bacterium]|nr:xanthine dehydrogenase family protein molybdopterin-binding subunit [Acidimicrobiales bacterium]